MNATQNETQNGTAGTPKVKTPENVSPNEWHTFPISELVAKTFEDGSRLNSPVVAAGLFESFETSVTDWLANYRDGKRLSRTVAIAISKLREAVTDLNGDPLWAVKGTTAWKVIYENRVAAFYISIGMDDAERDALTVAIKGYIRDRRIVDAVIADRAVRSTNNLRNEEWTIKGQKHTVGEVVAALLSDDQKIASPFEGATFPAKLKAAMDVEYKRQSFPKGHKKAGQRKQGFEKTPTYFGPVKETRAPATKNDETPVGNTGHATAKGHSDALRELTTSGSIGTFAEITFIREQLAAVNEVLLRVKAPKGGNVPGIVDALDAIAKECKLLADYKRPGDGRKPERDTVAKAAIVIDTK